MRDTSLVYPVDGQGRVLLGRKKNEAWDWESGTDSEERLKPERLCVSVR